MDEFITPEIITRKTIKAVLDGRGPSCSLVSVQPTLTADGNIYEIQLVIGALWKDRTGNYFGKGDLADLIELLKEIEEVMADDL